MHYVLSNYPLSKPYRARLEEKFGSALHYINTAELRQSSLRNFVNSMTKLRGSEMSIVAEEESGAALLPALRVVSLLASIQRRRTVSADMRVEPFGFFTALRMLVLLVFASLRSIFARLRVGGRSRTLLREQRFTPTSVDDDQHVAYLNCNLWYGVKAGGSVGHISGVVNAFLARGASVEFFTAGDRLLVREPVRFHMLKSPRVPALPFENTYYRFHEMCVQQIGAQLSKRKPAFIYQRMSLGNFAGVLLSRRLGVPLVLEYNGSEVWVAKHWGRPLRYVTIAENSEAVCLRHAHLIVTISDVLKQELIERGIEATRIVTYPNCIDPEMFDPAKYPDAACNNFRAELGFESADIIATFIGTFGQWHGVEVLATAIRSMIDTQRDFLDARRLRFLLVGDGLKMPLVRQRIGDSCFDKYVRLTGLVPQRDAPKYLAASNILLSPHIANLDGTAFFGSPTKLFEYMAMGKAIVASDLDQIGQVLSCCLRADRLPSVDPLASDRSLAVLTRPGSVDEIIASICFLTQQAKWRSVLGRNARQEALTNYTWHRHVDEIMSGFKRVRCSAASEADTTYA